MHHPGMNAQHGFIPHHLNHPGHMVGPHHSNHHQHVNDLLAANYAAAAVVGGKPNGPNASMTTTTTNSAAFKSPYSYDFININNFK